MNSMNMRLKFFHCMQKTKIKISIQVCVYQKRCVYRQFSCSDYDSDGSHDLIGSFTTTIAELEQAAASGKEVSA